MKAVHLQTEYLTNPLGIDITSPRFFWICEEGLAQTAYEIVCTRNGKPDWESGKVECADSTHIRYGGAALTSRDRVEWKVRLWDESGEAGPWSEAFFEMGLLHPADWKAKWISGNYRPVKNTRWPVGCFRKRFACGKEIVRARLYVTACGLYEMQLNGLRVGTAVLAPGNTDNRVRLQYQTYDVTELLRRGEENELTAELADGWYRGSSGAFAFTNVYGRMTKLFAQLEIDYADGTGDVICTNDSWDFSGDGPLLFADMKDGEVYDASRRPGYGGKTVVCAAEKAALTASNNVLVEKHESFEPTTIVTPSGKTVLDFGQNIAGFVAFDAQGKKGSKVHLRMGEMLDENGEFTQKNIQLKTPAHEVGMVGEILTISGMPQKASKELRLSPLQEVNFICSGGEDHYETRFAIFGFRYALLEADEAVKLSNIRSIAVYSSMEETSAFECSNPLVNQLYHNTLWSTKGNFCDVPLDCPTRERLGWTGDAQIFFNTGSFLMNSAAFYRKYMTDVWDAQKKNGLVPAVVPYNGAKFCYESTGSSVGWADVMELLPYRYWKRYGDLDQLRAWYPHIKKFAEYLLSHTGRKNAREGRKDPNNKYIYEKGFHLGEWAEAEEFADQFGVGSDRATAVRTEECTAYFSYGMRHLAEIAEACGDMEMAAKCREYQKGSAKAYEEMFLSPVPETDRQAKLVRPLYCDCATEKTRREVVDHLVDAVNRREGCVTTGFLSTPHILPMLSENGRSDMAYKMLENTKAPGWLYEVKSGATTVWETWEGDVSRNHYSPGAVCEWLFSYCAGIRVDGVRHFTVAPQPGGTLSYAEASYDSLYGHIASSWKTEDGKTSFAITVPSNTTATVCLPGIAPVEAGPGEHTWTL